MADYNTMELMICTASRELEDGASVGVGTGAPCAAAMLAQKVGAPNLLILFEAGGAGPLVPEMPISVGDSRTTWKAVMASGMCEIMETACRGMIDYTFLGGAQIDMYGNLNSTRIGPDHQKPKVRFPGSGGANDFGSFCWRMMVMTPQDAKRFAEKCSYVTTPGWLQGGTQGQERSSLGAGPHKIITNMAVMDFEPGEQADEAHRDQPRLHGEGCPGQLRLRAPEGEEDHREQAAHKERAHHPERAN